MDLLKQKKKIPRDFFGLNLSDKWFYRFKKIYTTDRSPKCFLKKSKGTLRLELFLKNEDYYLYEVQEGRSDELDSIMVNFCTTPEPLYLQDH